MQAIDVVHLLSTRSSRRKQQRAPSKVSDLTAATFGIALRHPPCQLTARTASRSNQPPSRADRFRRDRIIGSAASRWPLLARSGGAVGGRLRRVVLRFRELGGRGGVPAVPGAPGLR